MALHRGPRDRRHVPLVDLLALGRGVGFDPDRHRAGCMVLAEAGRDRRAPRAGEASMSTPAVPFPPNDLATQGARPAGEILDVSQLPSFAFGARGLMWWGTMGVIAIEGTVFALAIMAYFYLRANSDEWPMGVPKPDL